MVSKIVLLLLCLSVVIGAGGCYIEPAPYGFHVYPGAPYYQYPRSYRHHYYRPHRYYHHHHYHG